jgi:hypothetical protein
MVQLPEILEEELFGCIEAQYFNGNEGPDYITVSRVVVSEMPSREDKMDVLRAQDTAVKIRDLMQEQLKRYRDGENDIPHVRLNVVPLEYYEGSSHTGIGNRAVEFLIKVEV